MLCTPHRKEQKKRMNRPQIVMDLFEGRRVLTVAPIHDDGTVGDEQGIQFYPDGQDYLAVILGKTQACVKKTKSLSLDLDIILGMTALLFLLAAFTHPGRDTIFYIKKSRYSVADIQYKLQWDDGNKQMSIAE